jgi:hypothetical protein
MPIIATYNTDQPTEMEKQLLMSLVFTSDLGQGEKDEMMNRKLCNCTDYKISFTYNSDWKHRQANDQ